MADSSLDNADEGWPGFLEGGGVIGTGRVLVVSDEGGEEA